LVRMCIVGDQIDGSFMKKSQNVKGAFLTSCGRWRKKGEKENSFSRKEAGAISHAPDASGLNTFFRRASRLLRQMRREFFRCVQSEHTIRVNFDPYLIQEKG